MFSKFLVLAATVACALAQQDTINDNVKLTAGIDATLDSLAGVEDTMINAIGDTNKGVQHLDKLLADAADMAGTADVLKSDAAATATVFDEAFDMQMQFTAEAKMNELEMTLFNIEARLEAAISAAKADTGRLDAQKTKNMKLDTVSKALAARVAKHKKCAETKQMYDMDQDKCVGATLPFASTLPKVAHRMFNNDDSRDGGYINNREVTFNKENDDTFVRIYYHDNMRVHGHTSHGKWNVMICDANGNGCAHCKNPGKLMYWRYSSHQHNWWMNDHWGGALSGICKQSDNRVLKKGKFKLRVLLDSVRYSIYTGHNQHSSFMVDEVFKY